MISRSRPDPLVLCILDGWGERPRADDNAIAIARTPVWHRLLARWPHAQLQASEHYVGLPDGQMGNSEATRISVPDGSSSRTCRASTPRSLPTILPRCRHCATSSAN
jgi:hypothetical protein